MQKLILTAAILGLAIAVQAGETKNTSNAKQQKATASASCCSETKAEQTKASGSCCSGEKMACSASKQTAVRPVLMSPKAAAEYAKK